MKKLLVGITAALFVLAIGSNCAKAQFSYAETVQNIKLFETAKSYKPANTGPLFISILEGMVENNNAYMSEGLKLRLVGTVSRSKLNSQLNGVDDPSDGLLLILLYDTKQSVPLSLTDVQLKIKITGNGSAVKGAMQNMWATKEIASAKLVTCLEQYDPWTATSMASIISKPWYSPFSTTYENSQPTWAAQSMFNIHYCAGLVELAKRSVVVKMLRDHGYIYIPTEVDAQFIYSGWPSVPIYLDQVSWGSGDVADLQRLCAPQTYNNIYGAWAQQQLTNMGY